MRYTSHMAQKPLGLRMDPALIDRIDERAEQDGISRSVFIARAVEAALRDGRKAVAASRPSPGSSPPTPPRASVTHIGCERHPEAGAYRGANGNWWCAGHNCTKAARRQVA